jgi:hypothetical protein
MHFQIGTLLLKGLDRLGVLQPFPHAQGCGEMADSDHHRAYGGHCHTMPKPYFAPLSFSIVGDRTAIRMYGPRRDPRL